MTRDPPKSTVDVVCAVPAGVSRLVAGGLDEQQQRDVLDELAGLYSEHTDVRHPLAPLGDGPLRTRAELRQHFAEGPARTRGVERFEPVGTLVHETADPELVVGEFRYEGSAHGRSFSLPCIFVVRVRDGMVIESRDYSDHVAFARAFGQPGELAHALAGQAN